MSTVTLIKCLPSDEAESLQVTEKSLKTMPRKVSQPSLEHARCPPYHGTFRYWYWNLHFDTLVWDVQIRARFRETSQ
jgi:hypothetical protein